MTELSLYVEIALPSFAHPLVNSTCTWRWWWHYVGMTVSVECGDSYDGDGDHGGDDNNDNVTQCRWLVS